MAAALAHGGVVALGRVRRRLASGAGEPGASTGDQRPAHGSAGRPANSAVFSAAANGVPIPTWQWQSSTDGGVNWDDINGATAASYTTPATSLLDNGKRYRARASNASGAVVTITAALTVNVMDRSWQGALLIEANDGDAYWPEIAFDTGGNAITVWQQH